MERGDGGHNGNSQNKSPTLTIASTLFCAALRIQYLSAFISLSEPTLP